MALFIEVRIDEEKCLGLSECGRCMNVCPVQIFTDRAGMPVTVEENLDECTLCDLCEQKCEPATITVKKLYPA
jgi:NAD-dependent dihydropyrimidine dehydrogenase PreA subunit